MKNKFIEFISQTKNYARLTGAILFIIGLLGFAFRESSSIPDTYLGAFLVLGFWGVVIGMLDKN